MATKTIHPNVAVTQEQIAAFCEKWKITKLELFGSVLRADFRADSDVDVLATFQEDADLTIHTLVEMEDQLRLLFGREVDLVEREAVERNRNWIRRRNILSSARPIYAHRQ
jgi:predicted nucleotidyltransferase